MQYFKKYVSNTLAGSGNQDYFESNPCEVKTGRLYYKVNCAGSFNYSFLFTNIIDSTFADGSHSNKNLVCDSWVITRAFVGVAKNCNIHNTPPTKENLIQLTFNGDVCKNAAPGEFFATDGVELTINKNEYVFIEITFAGSMLPYHEESIIPTYVINDGRWEESKFLPFPSMIGCDRNVKTKIGFLGDSITQGCGTEFNSYTHWNAVLAEKLGTDYSYWNLGLGYGRANDAASNGAWLFKAKQMDMIVLCFGVNDLGKIGDAEQLKRDLSTIVTKLYEAGVKVIIQTIPPFDYTGETIEKWNSVNRFIKEKMVERVEAVFDVVPLLCKDSKHSHLAKYGGHPDKYGCEVWADGLYPILKAALNK